MQKRILRAASTKPFTLGLPEVRKLASEVSALTDGDGRATGKVASILRQIDQNCSFSPGTRPHFQDLLARVGVASTRPVRLPLNSEPYWLREAHPLANYQSSAKLPVLADVVIIGAGLTGASAAYHLADAAKNRGLRVLVLDRGDPAGEASGRNGGNFELIPENSTGIYEGLATERLLFLRRRYPGVPQEVLRAESERHASLVLGLSLRNRDRVKAIVQGENIDCDYCPRGWLYLAHTEREEQGICDEVMLAARHGQRLEIWSRRRIREQLGLRTSYLGRFIPGDGTYHPFKYVCGLLAAALRSGVELYTRTPVQRICSTGPDLHDVVTGRGTIVTRFVIAATNAFTRDLFPELAKIEARQSQIMLTEHAPDRTRGRVVTTEYGPAFLNQPRAGARRGRAPLLLGGGADRPMKNPSSRRRSPAIHHQLMRLRDMFYPELHGQPPSSEWVGPMAFTPDQLPVIGFLRPGVVIAAGYNGYGGSYTTSAGQAAALMALTRQVPEWVAEDVFSPRRLLCGDPLFMQGQDGLWRIATALCRQLRSVNQQIAEHLNYTPASAEESPHRPASPRMRHASRTSITSGDLKTFPAFRAFALQELDELLGLMHRWDASKGSLICEEGNPGGTCFVVLRGAVEVSILVRGQQHVLARLLPGDIFGQVSLIDGEPRSATCTACSDTVLAEMARHTCVRLFKRRSPAAFKFLGALNDGIILALRGADGRLLRLNGDQVATDPRAPDPQWLHGPPFEFDPYRAAL
jgi:glycine/D-amino acid oxidase-like deaminating enzyme